MKWKAGSGVTTVTTNEIVMLTQPAANNQGPTATVQWLLPDGLWWKVTQVRTSLDATNATAAIDVAVTINKIGYPGSKINLATPLAALTFDGTITFAANLPPQQSVPVGTVTAPLPDVWAPPGAVVTLTATTSAGFAVLQLCVMTAEGAELGPTA